MKNVEIKSDRLGKTAKEPDPSHRQERETLFYLKTKAHASISKLNVEVHLLFQFFGILAFINTNKIIRQISIAAQKEIKREYTTKKEEKRRQSKLTIKFYKQGVEYFIRLHHLLPSFITN